MVIDIGNESKSQRVCVSLFICFPKIVNLNKTLSDFPTILYLYTLFFICLLYTSGKHVVEMTVTDGCGNRTTEQFDFVW